MSSFKVVLLGEGRVGKSSIGVKWHTGSFDSQRRSTVAAAFYQKNIDYNGHTIDIQLWDTAGQEQYHSLTPIYYKDAQAAILVYSVTDSTSFERMVQWKRELNLARGESIKIIIAANKIDLASQRCVTKEQGQQFANQMGCDFFEVSAKSGDGIDQLFSSLAKTLASLPQKSAAPHRRPGKAGLQVVNGDDSAHENQNNKNCC